MGKLGFAFRCFFRALRDPDFGRRIEEAGRGQEMELPKDALRLLALLQEEGRLLDFLQEDISGFQDEQVGAAVRNIHASCGKVLRKFFEIVPVVEGKEGEEITVPQGFDSNAIRLVGRVSGNPPFYGIVRHHGWKIIRHQLPAGKNNPAILAEAEVELP